MEAIVQLLDPDASLIRGSRWAREDDHGTDRKFSHRLSSHVTSFSKRLLILDDSPHIWELGNSPLHTTVVPVDRYDFAEQLFSPLSGLALLDDADFFLRPFDGPLWMKIIECVGDEAHVVTPSNTRAKASVTPAASHRPDSPVGRLMQRVVSFLF
jgi:hypothetical protein